ncbi:unnamed protein product [Penicillium roqueforti FM164]|uniref:Genomic scaffold, ProqFM164S01 n=1 Tax=Penicillium roqueforti (strain FM164) TaxID=1365484 RepID=W6PPX4_PENRF|nr:unnamed protein product [Penicillium roqueforti FM164]
MGRGSGFQKTNPPTGLLTKTRPDPWGGFSWAGSGFGAGLARSSNYIKTNSTSSITNVMWIQRLLAPADQVRRRIAIPISLGSGIEM